MKQTIRTTEDSVPNWVPCPGTKDQHLTVDGTVRQFAALSSLTTHCVVNIQAADVRVTFDDDSPVGGSVGCLMPTGTFMYWSRTAVEKMKLVREGGSSAVAWLQEFRTAVHLPQ